MIITADSRRMTIDPVCKMIVDARHNPIFSAYKKDRFYFCGDPCRIAFVEKPAKYLDAKPEKPPGPWKRYLARLNKATGGKPPSCCG